jgi:pantoate--beta-alanine ligase
MEVCRTLPALTEALDRLRAARGAVGLVPTMGALHDGHVALLRAAQAPEACGAGVVASIFVNPLQFGQADDLARYPRDEAGDLAKLESEGCDVAWLPGAETMYPPGDATRIELTGPALRWEGDARPGHYRGVATVCAKLFGQVRPARAYFGEKDWQQVQVVTRMVRDLLFGPDIVVVSTVRESDGLALSSRNRFLTPEERTKAPRLPATLRALIGALQNGAPTDAAVAGAQATLSEGGFGVDYLALVEPETLSPTTSRPARLIVAARLGSVRLLDTMAVD